MTSPYGAGLIDPQLAADLAAQAQSLSTVTPRLDIRVDGMHGALVTIVRHDQSGNDTPVRSANPAPLVAGTWIGWDYEAPFQQNVTYTATSDTGDTITSGTRRLDIGLPWLIHPAVPDLSRPVRIHDISDKTRPVNRGVHRPLGRRTAVTITDGVRRAPEFDLILKTQTFSEAAALSDLLEDTQVLLLQVAYPWTSITNYWWVSIGDVVKHATTRRYGMAGALWTLPCMVTDSPAGLLQPQWTYADILANYSTYKTADADFASYADMVTDTTKSGN